MGPGLVGVLGGLRETPVCWLRRMMDDMSDADHGCILKRKKRLVVQGYREYFEQKEGSTAFLA